MFIFCHVQFLSFEHFRVGNDEGSFWMYKEYMKHYFTRNKTNKTIFF